jgi:predicted nucleic acid-binding Zn ribbon protein
MQQVNLPILALADALRNSPTSPGKVNFAWQAAVGPAMGRATMVVLEGTVLLVDAHSPHWTQELRRAAPMILSRLQTLLGRDVISELNIRA